MNKICNGCGAIMQNSNPNLPGYTPKLIDAEFCQRCFRIKNYNELPKIVANNEDYEGVIDSVIKKNGLIVFVVDIFAFKSTFNRKMLEKLEGKDVILVANKFDLFPKSTKPEYIVDWLSKECEKFSFKVLSIHVVSSKKGYFIDDLMNIIDIARKNRDVYFVGVANVGKSSLINALLKRFTSKTDDLIAESIIPGTTLNEIKILFFEDGKYLIDTPGLINESDILNILLPKSYRKIVPNSEIKAKTYQIYKSNTIFLAGLASLSITCNESVSAIVYTSNDLYIHRSKTENRDNLYKEQLGKLLTPPTLDEVKNLKYKTKTVNLDGLKKKTIWFSGFGFVSIIGKCKVDIKYIDKSEVYITNAI